jgi:adenine-specific DNA-methyltransferase
MKKGPYSHSYILIDLEGIDHILIEGDNKETLPLLQTEFKDKIDLIYLDPPYNTGNREGFTYMDKWTEWLEFMRERLVLAKSLMSDTGFLFISINEYEFAHLKLLCDEIFGIKNFVSYLVWKKRGTGGIPKCGTLITQTEFILIYAKNQSRARLNKMPSKQTKDSWRDFRKSGGAWQKKYRPKQCFPIYFDTVSSNLSILKTIRKMIKILPVDSKGVLGFWMNGKETTG